MAPDGIYGRDVVSTCSPPKLNAIPSALETLENAISELTKTCDELGVRAQAVTELQPTTDCCQSVAPPARMSPTACHLACAIDHQAERVEKLASQIYSLTQRIQL